MTVYAYDPTTGVAVDLARAYVVAEPAEPQIDPATFENLDSEGYAELNRVEQGKLRDLIIQELPATTHLVYCENNDRLDDNEIDHILRGDEYTLELRLQDDDRDQRRDTADEIINNALWRMTDDLNIDDLNVDDRRNLIDTVQNRDVSDPLQDRLRNTPAMFLRYQLAPMPSGGVPSGQRRQLLEDTLRSTGLDLTTDAARENITELLENTNNHWHEMMSIDVFVWVKPSQLVPTGQPLIVTVTDPTILVIDPVNGCGHEVSFTDTITLTVDTERDLNRNESSRYFFVDALGGFHYGSHGWEEIAGPTPEGYWDRVTVQPRYQDPTTVAAQRAMIHARKNHRQGLLVENPIEMLFPDGVPTTN